MSLLGRLVLAVTRRGLVRRLFSVGGWGRRVATRFVAGETLDEAVRVAGDLNARGFLVSLDHLGEHVSDLRLAAQARDEYLEAIDRIAAEGLQANISVKLTQLGLGRDDAFAEESLRALAAAGGGGGHHGHRGHGGERPHPGDRRPLLPGAGRPWATWAWRCRPTCTAPPPTWPGSCRWGATCASARGPTTSPRRWRCGAGAQVDEAFRALLGDLMACEGIRPAVATHDDRLVAAARELARTRREPFEFQMLYGIRAVAPGGTGEGGLRRCGSTCPTGCPGTPT